MEIPEGGKNRGVEESEEENILAVHYPEEVKRLTIKFRDSSTPTSTPGQSGEVRGWRRENGETFDEDDNEDEEESEKESNAAKVSSPEGDFDFRRGIYKCGVYICASVICLTITSGVVAVGYVFHLGSR